MIVTFPASAEARRRLSEEDPKWPIKAWLRIICAAFAFLAMLMLAISVSLTNQRFINEDGPGDWTDGMGLAPVILSLLFNPLILAFIVRYRQGKVIHPGWYVGADLIIWALCVPAIVLVVGDGWFWYWQPTLEDENGFVECGFLAPWNTWAKACEPVIYTIGGMEIAASVFLFMLLFIHFALFIMACKDTKRWRAAKKRAKVERHNIELQYHRSPEEHMAQQPPAYSPQVDRQAAEDADGAVKYS